MFSLTLHSDPYLADKCPFSRKKRGESRCTPVNYHSHGKAAMLMELARKNREFPMTILLPEIILTLVVHSQKTCDNMDITEGPNSQQSI